MYAGPAWVTLAYVALYYAFLCNILRVKQGLRKQYKQRGEKFDRYHGQDPVMLAADRTQLNMLEQMPPFLILLWLHAVFVSPQEATLLGAIYTGSRVLYPLLMGKELGRQIPMRILVVTVTGYAIIAILVVRIAMSI